MEPFIFSFIVIGVVFFILGFLWYLFNKGKKDD